MVENYLNTLLPDNWDAMSLFERKNFLSGDDFGGMKTGTVERTQVSNAEIWCECFGKSKEEMRPSDSYAMSAIMVRIEGWVKSGVRQMLPIYGRQRVYTRTA